MLTFIDMHSLIHRLDHLVVGFTWHGECQRIHRIELFFAAAPAIWFGELLYSGKLSREKTLVIFRVFAIVFFGKFGGLVSLCSTSEQSAKEFSAKITRQFAIHNQGFIQKIVKRGQKLTDKKLGEGEGEGEASLVLFSHLMFTSYKRGQDSGRGGGGAFVPPK